MANAAGDGGEGRSPGPAPLVARPEDPRLRRARRRGGRLLVLGGLLGALVAFHGPLLSGYARLFRIDDPAPSDAIVVLLGGLGHRPQHAAALYRRGVAPRVLLATLDATASPFDETRQTIAVLRQGGVPPDAITVMPQRCESTRDEANAVRALAGRAGFRRITVVTSAFHTRRSRWIFRRVFAGTGVAIHMAAAEQPRITEANWWRSDEGLVTYVDETVKTLYYWLRH
jgi:uncharacterized SAM-binding protein YcdF (DUF218 family)